MKNRHSFRRTFSRLKAGINHCFTRITSIPNSRAKKAPPHYGISSEPSIHPGKQQQGYRGNSIGANSAKGRRVLIIVENLPVPFDRRVWQEATTLTKAGYQVSVICPTGRNHRYRYEEIDGVAIYRHPLPFEARNAAGYFLEYSFALTFEFLLAWRVLVTRGFDVIHACNPPDNIFLIGLFFKLFGKKFLFDHHDINPELYEAKFGRRDMFYRLILACERWSFRAADIAIATNESYRRIAIERGGMAPEKVYTVRSGPDPTRLIAGPAVPSLKNGRQYMVGYVGVMGQQEGIDCLLRILRDIVFARKRHDIQFCLVGGGPVLKNMKAYASELGIQEYVNFTGRIPDSEMLDVLNTADVCVNSDVANTMNDKSTMNKVMEYMALGKAIVQFDLTEGRVSAQRASLYAKAGNEADFADKILSLLDNPALCRQMGDFGRRRVEQELQWNREVPKLLAAYQALWEPAGDIVTDDLIAASRYPKAIHSLPNSSSGSAQLK